MTSRSRPCCDAQPDARVDQEVDLDDLVLSEADRVRHLGRRRVDVSRVSSAQVRGDAKRIRRAIANIADNAERHAASTIRFSLAEVDNYAELVVSDDGAGVPADQAEAVFERFVRLDEARERHAGGAGLGLAIAREIIEGAGGTLVVDPSATVGARFVLRLPCSTALSSPARPESPAQP